MENFEIMRMTWKQASSANNQELFALVANCKTLDERTQIIAAQRGDNKVLETLFNQEELCQEALLYMAKRGNDEIHALLLEKKFFTNSVACTLAEKASLKNATTLIEQAPKLSEQAQINIIDRDNVKLVKALVKRKDLSGFAKRHLAQYGGVEVIEIFLNQNLSDMILEIIAERNVQEINSLLLKRENLPSSVLDIVINHCKPSMLETALARKDITCENLKTMAKRAHTDLFDKMLVHPLLTTDVIAIIVSRCTFTQLEQISKRSYLDEDVQEAIIKKIQARTRKKTTPNGQELQDPFNETDREIVLSIMERENLSSKAMCAIIKLGIEEFIDILVVEDNLPARVQNEISTLKNDKYLKILLNSRRLSPGAEVNIVKTRNSDFIFTLLNREDLSEEAIKEIYTLATKQSDKHCISAKEAQTRQAYIQGLFKHKLPEEVAIKIVKTKNLDFIIKLLSQKSLTEKTLSEIKLLNNKMFSRIIAEHFA